VAKRKLKKMLLRYTFTTEEQADLAMIMAEKNQELKSVQQSKRTAVAQFKSDEERVQSEIDNAARRYKDGYEMRDIECEEFPDFDEGVIRYYRTDNNELAQVHKMTNEDRQMRLDEINKENDSIGGSEEDDYERDRHQRQIELTMAQETSSL